jgi:hypothetical protein
MVILVLAALVVTSTECVAHAPRDYSRDDKNDFVYEGSDPKHESGIGYAAIKAGVPVPVSETESVTVTTGLDNEDAIKVSIELCDDDKEVCP